MGVISIDINEWTQNSAENETSSDWSGKLYQFSSHSWAFSQLFANSFASPGVNWLISLFCRICVCFVLLFSALKEQIYEGAICSGNNNICHRMADSLSLRRWRCSFHCTANNFPIYLLRSSPSLRQQVASSSQTARTLFNEYMHELLANSAHHSFAINSEIFTFLLSMLLQNV